jgi:thioredoxin-related protein
MSLVKSLPFLRASVAAVCLAALSSAGSAGEATWFADFDLAQKEAQKSGKDLLVDFTGSDWCGWCIRLHEEVFDHEAFDQGVAEHFVLVALDFPKGEEAMAKVPNPQRNQALSVQHGIRGFPTILLMTGAGEVYASTGYREGGPEAYVTHLGELRTSGKAELQRLSALVAAFDQASPEAKPAAWDAIADAAQALEKGSPFAARLAPALTAAFALDKDNAQGRKLRALELLFTLDKVDDAVGTEVRAFDPKNERGMLERLLLMRFGQVSDDKSARAAIEALTQFEASASFADKQRALQVYARAARWLARNLKDPEGAKVWAQKALDLGLADEQLQGMLEEIVAQ